MAPKISCVLNLLEVVGVVDAISFRLPNKSFIKGCFLLKELIIFRRIDISFIYLIDSVVGKKVTDSGT